MKITSFKANFSLFTALWFVLTLCSSCSKKTEVPDPGNENNGVPGSITVPDANGTDTVFTTGYFEVDVATDSLKNCQLDVIVEGSTKFSQKSNLHRFIIPVETFGIEGGIYKTVLNAYNYTAGNPGNKQFLSTKSIILIYFKSPYPFTPDLIFSNSQGTLVCRLTIPQTVKPVSKILVEKSVGSNEQFYPLYSINGSSPFVFSDTTYVGEKADFRITTYFSNEDKKYYFPQNTGVVHKPQEPMTVTHLIDNNGFPVVQWPKTAYPANCNGYRIFTVYPGVKKDVDTIPSVDQTTYNLNDVAFPGVTKVYVSAIPKGPPPYYNNDLAMNEYSGKDTATAGIPWPSYWQFYAPVGDDFFTVKDGVITGYSTSTLAVTHQIPPPDVLYSHAVSPNNKYLLAFAWVNSAYKYILYHIPTKTLTYVPANLVYPNVDRILEMSVSDNGIGVLGSSFGKVLVYDFVHDILLGELNYFDYPRPVVSPNGEYFFILDDKWHLYKNDNGTFTETWTSQTFDDYYILYSFLPSDGTKAMVIQSNVCSVRNAADWSLVRSFPVDYIAFLNSDFNGGTIFGRNENSVQLVDFNSGKVLYSLYSKDPMSGYVNNSGNNLFCGNGLMLRKPVK